MDKQQEISRQILDKAVSIAACNGQTMTDRTVIRAAFDHVLGQGAFDQLVSDLYDDLRSRKAA